MLATALAVLSALAQPASPEVDLRGSSIVLVEGICGGLIAPTRHRIVSFGYDWNRGTFRAVEQCPARALAPGGRVFGARDLDGDRFRKLVDRVLELGLPALPLEEPAGGEDLYHRNTGIRFSHAARVWENRAPDGCVHMGTKVQVTTQQVAVFDAVVALLNGALAEGPLQPASALDAPSVRDRSDQEVRALARAVDVLRGMGQAGDVNANEALIEDLVPRGLSVRIPCRSVQPCRSDFGHPVASFGWWDLRFNLEGDRIQEVHETPVPGERRVIQARRTAFVAAHPELLAPQRDLILAGWVGDGMSEEMVYAAWGTPVDRKVEPDGVALRYMRGSDPRNAQVTLHVEATGLRIRW